MTNPYRAWVESLTKPGYVETTTANLHWNPRRREFTADASCLSLAPGYFPRAVAVTNPATDRRVLFDVYGMIAGGGEESDGEEIIAIRYRNDDYGLWLVVLND